MLSTQPEYVYECRPCKDHRDFDLISDALPFGPVWYAKHQLTSLITATGTLKELPTSTTPRRSY
jgi:hypothetical protein